MFAFPFIVAFVSSVFWIFPAIRNYKTNLFLYFLILAISDPIVITASFLIPMLGQRLYLLFSLLTIASLRNLFSSKTLYLRILILLLLFGVTAAFTSITAAYISIIIDHICAVFIFLVLLLSYVSLNSKVKGYHIILLLYEVSIILKVLFFVLNVELGLGYFYTTTIFEMLIAVFFSVYKETDNKLLIDLKNV